jgi:hypothetical protein
MKKGLRNPALITAVASSPQGQKAINSGLETANEAVSTSVSIVKGVFVLGALFGVGVFAYNKIFNGFKKLPEDRKMKATISTAIAKNKATAIFRAMYGIGSNFSKVLKILSGTNGNRLNANDFVRIYNQFGKRAGATPLSKGQNMIEWFTDFNERELLQLKALFPDFF